MNKPLLTALLCLACGSAYAAPSATLEQRWREYTSAEDSIARSDLSKRMRDTGLMAAYKRFTGGMATKGRLAALSDDDVLLLFRAASNASFYTSDALPTMDMALLASELHARGLLQPEAARTTHDALYAARLFPAARTFRQRYAIETDLKEPSQLAGKMLTGQTTELVFDPGRKAVKHQVVIARTGSYVLAVTHPACHFSRDMIDALVADADVGKLMPAHFKLLAPQLRDADFNAFFDWNHAHTDLPQSLAFKSDEWPMIVQWNTPNLYFIKDGVVMATLTGWPREGRHAEVKAGLQLIGLP